MLYPSCAPVETKCHPCWGPGVQQHHVSVGAQPQDPAQPYLLGKEHQSQDTAARVLLWVSPLLSPIAAVRLRDVGKTLQVSLLLFSSCKMVIITLTFSIKCLTNAIQQLSIIMIMYKTIHYSLWMLEKKGIMAGVHINTV